VNATFLFVSVSVFVTVVVVGGFSVFITGVGVVAAVLLPVVS
jgi:hypothetical protein